MKSKLSQAKEIILSAAKQIEGQGRTIHIHCRPEEQMYFDQAMTLTEVVLALGGKNNTVIIVPQDPEKRKDLEDKELLSLALIAITEHVLQLSEEEGLRLIKAMVTCSATALTVKPIETAIKLSKYFPLSISEEDTNAGVKLYKTLEEGIENND